MKFLIFGILPFYLMANDSKRIEWFPQESKEDNLNKIPCEENFLDPNPWQIRPWDTGGLKKREFIKGPLERKTCKFISLKF